MINRWRRATFITRVAVVYTAATCAVVGLMALAVSCNGDHVEWRPNITVVQH